MPKKKRPHWRKPQTKHLEFKGARAGRVPFQRLGKGNLIWVGDNERGGLFRVKQWKGDEPVVLRPPTRFWTWLNQVELAIRYRFALIRRDP